MPAHKPQSPEQIVGYGTVKSYLLGFLFSLLLTLCSFGLVIKKPFTKQATLLVISALALIQAIFQLVYFLNLAKDAPPRWKLLMFGFMLLVLVILITGTLWIMYNLNYNMMPH
jgi:cytochrome o ubiquinol oxidase subunit IV